MTKCNWEEYAVIKYKHILISVLKQLLVDIDHPVAAAGVWWPSTRCDVSYTAYHFKAMSCRRIRLICWMITTDVFRWLNLIAFPSNFTATHRRLVGDWAECRYSWSYRWWYPTSPKISSSHPSNLGRQENHENAVNMIIKPQITRHAVKSRAAIFGECHKCREFVFAIKLTLLWFLPRDASAKSSMHNDSYYSAYP